MRRIILFFLVVLPCISESYAITTDTTFITPFERSKGLRTATYIEVMDFYKRLQKAYTTISIGDMGPADNGYPVRSVSFTRDGKFEKDDTRNSGKLIILISNDIHPGEPDGVDACMMLLRDAATGKINVPDNVLLVVVPIYNVGGALNRNSTSRINQNGPESYGFRGNARNLDLNRDFVKCDAAETIGMEDLFTTTNPDIFIDNHVSDGADYQHIITLIATQHDKLGGATGDYMYHTFTPLLYKEMKEKGYDMVPYVNDFDNTPDKGWKEFYESPRFSSGYAALFQTMAYVPETHMLKPFKDRVKASYDLMQTFIHAGSANAAAIKKARADDRAAMQKQKEFALDWRVDTTRCDSVMFRGYEAGYKPSEISGLPRLYYDKDKPFTKKVPFYDHFVPAKTVTAPRAYVIPKAWIPIINCLRANNVRIQRLNYDSTLKVTVYHIDNYESLNHPYEKHYLHKNVQVTASSHAMRFYEGDYIVWLTQPAKRYLVETLEPTGPDAFFAWNFFDGILQQKEYFSAYVFEDIAADLLRKNPDIRKRLDDKKQADPVFAKDGAAQLDFVYRESPYFEPEYLRYPVYRLESQ